MTREPRNSFVPGRIAFLGAALLVTTQCSNAPTQGEHWRVVGQLSGAKPVKFVEVEKASAQDGAVYKDAVSALCSDSSSCDQIAFYLPADPVPPSTDYATFFQGGGFKPYPATVIYSDGEFTKWDCDRAGSKDAPVSALCGDVRGQYEAVEKLALRVSFTKSCNSPATKDEQLVRQFIAHLSDKARAAEFEKEYADDAEGSVDADHCANLPEIERDARDARRVLQREIASPSAQS